MTYRDLWMWHIAYGKANGGFWDWQRSEWVEKEQ